MRAGLADREYVLSTGGRAWSVPVLCSTFPLPPVYLVVCSSNGEGRIRLFSIASGQGGYL